MGYIMALDQGTTSSRCILFDKKGTIRSVAQKEIQQIYPLPGWVEHNPNEIWETQYEVMLQAMRQLEITGDQVHAIGITNQRETTVIWDRHTGVPIYNGIVWQCRRTSERIEKLKEDSAAQGKYHGLYERLREKTGLIPDPYFSATKIAWILDNVDGARLRAENGDLLFGTIDTWLIWKLTKGTVHVTDYTNASRTMLFDIHKLQWDKEALEYFGIPENILPEVRPSSYIYGYTALEPEGIPISGAAGDQQCALFGQCGFVFGDVKNTYGTGCFMLMNIGEKAVISEGLVTTIVAGRGDKVNYALEGSVFVGGAAMQWLRDEMKMVTHVAESEACAQSIEGTDGVYVVPAFSGLGAPYWNPEARGMITGMTLGSGKKQIIRATLESIAYQVHDILQLMVKDTGMQISVLKVDGGASANNYLMQFQANLLNCTVERPCCIETTALGAAYLAGLAVGYWKDEDEIKLNWNSDRVFLPSMEEEIREDHIKGWHRAVSAALAWENTKER